MINDDDTHQALALLEEMKHGLQSHTQAVKEHFDARMRASDEKMKRRVAAISDEAKLSRRLADMKLPCLQKPSTWRGNIKG
jgi:hypothetical protein